MTNILLAALVAFAMAAAIECYLLLGRVQLLITFIEQLLAVASQLLAAVPGKSAQRTMASVDDGPRAWFPKLRILAELRERLDARHSPVDDVDQVDDDVDDAAAAAHTEPAELEADRWADDGGPPAQDEDEDLEDEDLEDQTPTDTFPAIDPPTTPAGLAIDAWQHTEIPPRTDLDDTQPDDVDLALARWGLRTHEGRRR